MALYCIKRRKSKVEKGEGVVMKKKEITEKELILSVLWEGDLELHTNKEKVKSGMFGERILHGDAVLAIVLGEIRNMHRLSDEEWTIENFSSSYRRPVYVGDFIWTEFRTIGIAESHRLKLSFNAYKNDNEVIMQGDVCLIIEN